MAVQRDRDRELSRAAGQLQHRTGLLPGEVRIKRQVRADRQERVVEVRVIVEVRGQTVCAGRTIHSLSWSEYKSDDGHYRAE